MRTLYVMLLFALPTSAMASDCRAKDFWYVNEDCLSASTISTNQQVEKVYDTLLKGTDEIRRPLLVAAHIAWREYRNHQCSLEFDTTRVQHAKYPAHGSMAPSMQQRCLIRLNDTRLLELQALAKRS